tara:strand:- start:430 stop:582 length:153 start_codon:yes stop_codon:yes gene_type:complete
MLAQVIAGCLGVQPLWVRMVIDGSDVTGAGRGVSAAQMSFEVVALLVSGM